MGFRFQNESLVPLEITFVSDCIDAWNNSASIQTDLVIFQRLQIVRKVLSINLCTNSQFFEGLQVANEFDFAMAEAHAHRTKSYNTDLDIIPVIMVNHLESC